MTQMMEVRGRSTRVFTDDGKTIIQYHATRVVEFTPDTITLRSGGYETFTTKARMNQAAHQYSLGYSVYQARRIWYVTTPAGEFPFTNGMQINRATGEVIR